MSVLSLGIYDDYNITYSNATGQLMEIGRKLVI